MRKILFIFLIGICFFDAHAQVDRRIGPSQYNNGGQNKKIDVVETTLETLKKELTLDGFQEAIVKNLLKYNQSKSKEIIESTEYEDLKKKDMLETLAENFNIEMRKILSKDQSAKYEKLISKKKK